MKSTYFVLLSFFIFSCSQSKVIVSESYNNPQVLVSDNIKDQALNKQNTINPNQKLNLIPISEMEDIPGFNLFMPNDPGTLSKEKIKADISIYREQIKTTNLVAISKWAIKEMNNYKLSDSAFDNFSIEKFYTLNSESIVKIKLDSLPSHSPLVKRFLYLFNNYDSKNNLKDFYITIQGYAEE